MSAKFRIAICAFLLLQALTPALRAGEGFADSMFIGGKSQNLLPDFTDSYGVVFRDLNRDFLPEIYVVRFRNLNRLFLNEGPGNPFSDFTIQSGLGGNLMPRGQENLELGASSGDFNNDGLPDMVIAGWGVSTRLFLQQKGLRFLDITDRTQIKPPLDGNGAFWADVNLDGNLDLFITDEHHPNHLFLGNGLGNFVDRSEEWGFTRDNVSQGAAFADVDDDGLPDLYVCNWFAPDVFLRNTGQNRFEPQNLNLKHLTEPLNSNGVSFGDIDNDGDPDLLVTDRNGRSALYRNDTPPRSAQWIFTDITDASGLQVPYPAYGSVISDFNNDGWPDIWISTIGPNMFFVNRHGIKFEKAFEEHFANLNSVEEYSTGAAAADVDNDGDLDLFASQKDTNSALYINPLNSLNFIKFRLTGVRSNRDAIGAKIWLFPDGLLGDSSAIAGFREIRGGGGYLSENSLQVHFGLPAPGLYDARIVFPGGRELFMPSLQSGKFYRVSEYTGIMKSYYRAKQYGNRLVHHPHFFVNIILFAVLIGILIGFTIISTGRFRWATAQIILFLVTTIIILYGIFLAFQSDPLRTRLIIQIAATIGLLSVLTFFMEKIRRLEISRLEYRRLLLDFSQDLIFIKNNQELYRKLVQTIYETVHPAFCAFLRYESDNLYPASVTGKVEIASEVSFAPESKEGLLIEIAQGDKPLTNRPPFPDGYYFPVSREEKFFGILLIGAAVKRDFTLADLAVFRALAAQSAVAIENNLYIEETRQLIRQVTEAQTREKYLSQLENAYRELEEKNRRLEELYRDLKDTQSQLVQSEKMASLGQLMAGIAHELNNPISFIYANLRELDSYSQVVRKLLEPIAGTEIDADALLQKIREVKNAEDLEFILTDLNKLVEESLQGSLRVKELVQNLRNFSRVDEAQVKEVDLQQGINSTLQLLNNEMKGRITLHKDYGALPKVYCNPGQINQVFMNLLLNAIQAIEGEGNIWITTRLSNSRVIISIRDDGKGIPQETLSKIFDPFFTTKPVGQGTGLGLSISYSIIQNHGGDIEVESEKRKGTVFRIILPVGADQFQSGDKKQ
ncbi:MAG: FG-GAP-like repeat-containing protein [Calditrichia bacterium]